MSRFYAEIQGNRGLASRHGTEKSGMWAHVRGWNVGAEVRCWVNGEGLDVVDVYRTGGSNGYSREKLIARIVEGDV